MSPHSAFSSAKAKAEERRRAFVDAAFAKATQADLLAPAEAPARGSAHDIFQLAEDQDRADRARVKVVFVSTNSICQGEQVGPLWGWLLKESLHVDFAHRAFVWNNDASGRAAVHCVVIGLTVQPPEGRRRLFDHADPAGPAAELPALRINPYLVDAPDVIAFSRRRPICKVPEIVFGSIGVSRWCLWLVDCPPERLAALPAIRRRVASVKAHASNRAAQRRSGWRRRPNCSVRCASQPATTCSYLATRPSCARSFRWVSSIEAS